MKKLILPVVLAIAALASMPGRAATDTKTFDVTVNLTAVCSVTTAPGTITLAYTDGQAGAVSNTTNFGVTCTNGLPYTLAVNAPVALAGLTYTLALRDNGDTTDIAGGTGAGAGSPASYKVKATLAGGQAGNCGAPATVVAGGCNQTHTHTLTLTY